MSHVTACGLGWRTKNISHSSPSSIQQKIEVTCQPFCQSKSQGRGWAKGLFSITQGQLLHGSIYSVIMTFDFLFFFSSSVVHSFSFVSWPLPTPPSAGRGCKMPCGHSHASRIFTKRVYEASKRVWVSVILIHRGDTSYTDYVDLCWSGMFMGSCLFDSWKTSVSEKLTCRDSHHLRALSSFPSRDSLAVSGAETETQPPAGFPPVLPHRICFTFLTPPTQIKRPLFSLFLSPWGIP